MKLLRYGTPGAERPGVLHTDGTIRSLADHVGDITPATLAGEGLAELGGLDPVTLPEVAPDVRLGPPIGRPGNLLCIGLNYRDHAAEAGLALPDEPIVFSKHTGALSGPNDPVRLPPGSTRLDYEVELAVVIGRDCAGPVSERDALTHVGGYTVCNDVSERDDQFNRGGQWIKGKSYPTFLPLGPVLVTADEIPDPQALRLTLSVNGEPRQDGSTADMVFRVAELVSYLSRFMPLAAGDVIATGTPKGVGMGLDTYLRAGDVMRLGIEGIGEMTQTVIADPA